MNRWLRDLLIIPLIVGLIVAVVTFVLPKIFEPRKELSYTIDAPIKHIDPDKKPTIGSLKIEINGMSTSSLFSYQIKLWNSGNIPMKDLPILVSFEPTIKDFKILNITHDTIPPKEFGKITEDKGDEISRRFIYDLLNKNDSDTITVMTSGDTKIHIYSKQEGLSLKKVTPASESKSNKFGFAEVMIGALGALMAAIITSFSERFFRSKNPKTDHKASTQ